MSLTVSNVSHSWTIDGETQNIYENISFNVKQGESLAITGVSGSGKSTMLQIITGLLKPSHGTVTLLNKNLGDLSSNQICELRKNSIAFIYQSISLVPNLTARENIDLLARLINVQIDEGECREIALRLNINNKLNSDIDILSGGERQRVGILRALLMKPRLLIADEPTSNLDKKNSIGVASLLKEWSASSQTSIIISTHDPVCRDICDQIIEL